MPLLLLSGFVVTRSVLLQAMFLLMTLGGLGFIYLTREKK